MDKIAQQLNQKQSQKKMPSNRVIVAQLGARQDYTVPLAIQNLGWLENFYTDIYLSAKETRILSSLSQIPRLGKSISKLLSRQNGAIDFSKVKRFNSFGLRYIYALNHAQTLEEKYQLYIDYGRKFNATILQHKLPEATHLYAFDHAALALFQNAKSKGMCCILDQIYAGPAHEQIAQEEEAEWEDWVLNGHSSTFYTSTVFQEWCSIQTEEWALADRIVVASRYTRNAITKLQPSLQSKLQIVPLTVNLDSYAPYQHVRRYSATQPLRVLFVGRVSILKGIQYLLKAFEQIPPNIAQLAVVGSIHIRPERLMAYSDKVDFRGSVPYIEIPKIYHDYDVLVFPTISDGFGAVMLEAMATGLPVIATENCGDIVEDGINGYRIPIRSATAIVEKILNLANNPDLLTQLSEGAIATCRQYSLQSYQAQLFNALNLN